MWTEINNQSDIDLLLSRYGGFHDSCIVEMDYKSGDFVDENKTMHFGSAENKTLRVLLQRQWTPVSIELLFSGVKKFYIEGWYKNYVSLILDCHLAIHNEVYNDQDVIIWADSIEFQYPNIDEGSEKPTNSYIIAEKLKWRFVD